MQEFIFPLEQIYGLANDSTKYYIGPYQRGYKWASLSRFDQVPQLLVDIYTASGKGNDYYLQYITIKEDKEGGKFEVIDGQQRLTTLSLLYYLLDDDKNIAKDKVIYSRYNDGNIFDKVIEIINTTATENDENIDSQDLYYMVKAAREMKRFLTCFKDKEALNKFLDFLNHKVMLIVNTESEFVEAEEVFMNLNNNRVLLTDSYLIKGLLLTLSVRQPASHFRKITYKEIMDQRVIMGRLWDEINSWIGRKEVSHFFFKDAETGMNGILKIALDIYKNKYVALAINNSSTNSDKDNLTEYLEYFDKTNGEQSIAQFELFNQFNEVVRTPEEALEMVVIIKHIYRKLYDIYENHEDSRLYNLLGFVMFCEKTADGVPDFKLSDIIGLSLDDIKKRLSELAVAAIPDMKACRGEDSSVESQYSILRYKSNNPNPHLRNHLLSLNVFPEVEEKRYRFNFYEYDKENWTFEHISPQHPKSTLKIHKSAIRNVIIKIKKQDQIDDATKKALITSIENGESVEAKNIAFLYDEDIDIHSVGNMALLSGGANSALNNNPYMAKRGILFDLLSRGKFIPRHTLDVFNKVLNTSSTSSFSSELMEWKKDEDLKAHIEWMENANSNIRSKLIKNYTSK